jgi:hypothetical protein
VLQTSQRPAWSGIAPRGGQKGTYGTFYCSKSEGQGTPPLEVLRSFVAQFALSPDGLSVDESVKRLVEGPMSSELLLEQCSKRPVALVAPHRRVTLVVGALNECENYKELLRRLIAGLVSG